MSSRNPSTAMRQTQAILLALTGLFLLIGVVKFSGFCFRELGYIPDSELIRDAVAYRARYIRQLGEKFSSEETAAYLKQNPVCCRVDTNFLPISPFDKIFGFSAKWVRIVHELPADKVSQSPRDGNFYEAYVRVGCCGQIYESTGMRLTESEAVSIIGKIN
jgi:hypothetical protein